MPRKFLQTHLPKAADLQRRGGLGILGRHLMDPELWHLNRQCVSSAFAVGLFVAWLPIPAQMVVAALIAVLVRSNLAISVVLVWVSNPLTMPAMLLFAYRLGAWILGEPPVFQAFELSWEWFRIRMAQIWAPLLVGSLVTGAASAGLGWASMQVIWRWHVVQRWERRRNARRLRAIVAAKEAEERAAEDRPASRDGMRN